MPVNLAQSETHAFVEMLHRLGVKKYEQEY